MVQRQRNIAKERNAECAVAMRSIRHGHALRTSKSVARYSERCSLNNVGCHFRHLLPVGAMDRVMFGNRQAKLLSILWSDTEADGEPCIQTKVHGRASVDADVVDVI